jgi:NAD(P)H-dependent FMN reductase
MRSPRQYPNDEVRQVGEALDRADGFVVLVAEYNHGYTAVLKNIIDWTWIEWRRKPMTFVGWGNVGGARAIEQLRLVAVELEAVPLRHAVHILPDVLIPARTGDPEDLSVFEPLAPRLDLLAKDLEWWMHALTPARAATEAASA